MSEPSGMLMFEVPVLQVPDPLASVVTRLTTQVLVAAPLGFGIGSGAPKRHPVSPGYSGVMTPAEVQKRFSVPAGTPGLPATSAVPVAARLKVPAVLSQVVSLVKEVPLSGMIEGNGTPTPAPPK